MRLIWHLNDVCRVAKELSDLAKGVFTEDKPLQQMIEGLEDENEHAFCYGELNRSRIYLGELNKLMSVAEEQLADIVEGQGEVHKSP